MAAARMIHPQVGRDAKVAALSDMEFRVFIQYLLSADDFGVMPAEAVVIQAGNAALKNRPAKRVQAAIDTIIQMGLLSSFEHEGTKYVWNRKWQDYQDVRWPRRTAMPLPPDVSGASEKTRELFRRHTVGAPKNLGNVSEELPLHARAPRAQARNTNAKTETDLDLGKESARENTALSTVPPVWRKPGRHEMHAFCGRLCVPWGLHTDFCARLGGPDASERLMAWYAATLARYEGQPIGDNLYDFWNHEFAAWVGTVTVKPAAGSKTGDTVNEAKVSMARRLGKMREDAHAEQHALKG